MSKKDKNKKFDDSQEENMTDDVLVETSSEQESEENLKEAKAPQAQDSKNNDETENLKKEIEESKDKFLRLYADFENYKKRTRAEKESAYSNAVCDIISTFLPVLDNLERAIASAGDDEAPLKKGVSMVYEQFNACLGQLGVAAYGEKGDSFDPNIHEAVMHTEEEGVAPNTITDVLQKGYRINEKIIRHALVKVVN